MNDLPTPNVSAFGSIGFGFATILLALYFAEILDSNGLSVILATALFAGGLSPLIAGLWSLKTGNTFAASAFLLGAIFWFSYVFTAFLPALGITTPIIESALAMWVQVPYFFLWGLLAFWLFLGSMKTHRILQIFFFLLAIFFWLLALGHWFAWDTWTNSGSMVTAINVLAGWEGVVCGFIGIYYGLALILKDTYKRDILPLGKIKE